jgi:hypothetical protein
MRAIPADIQLDADTGEARCYRQPQARETSRCKSSSVN